MTRERAYRLRALIEKAIESLEDVEALDAVELHSRWKSNKEYVVGERVRYNDVLYKCLQSHTSMDGWEPDVAVSLWARVLIPDPEVIPVWEQPDSTNAYMTGDKVHYPDAEGPVYESLIDNNTWSPEAYPAGWQLVSETDSGEEGAESEVVNEWEQGTYMTGDRVSFNGSVYESLIDNNVWSPEGYPAGWQLVE